MDPGAEIDITAPFDDTPWIPRHLLRLAAAAHENESMEEQVERDLMTKEQQTRNVLKELESAKLLVESLKANLRPELASFMSSPPDRTSTTHHHHGPSVSPRLMYTELNQAKLGLTKTSSGLASIQSSLESLNAKLRKDKVLLEKMHIHNLDKQTGTEDVVNLYNELKELNFEAEQFRKMTEASRNEVVKAMAEIERTKHSIRMAEMRLDAAKKMEEAAKAIEAIAIAERNQYFFDEEVDAFDGYRRRKSLERTNVVATSNNNNKYESATFKFRNSYAGHRNIPEESLTSLGDVLSRRKLVVQDDGMLGRPDDEERVLSLSQMLRGPKVVARPDKATTTTTKVDVVEEKRWYFFHKKKFGFIHVPVYSRRKKH